MGSIAFDFLADSILFEHQNISSLFEKISDELIYQELESYRAHILLNKDELYNDAKEGLSSLKVFSTIEQIPVKTLIQSALYIDQFIIDDPIFRLAGIMDRKAHQTGTAEYLGYQRISLDRVKLSEDLAFLKSVTPMVAADYIKILPISLIFEPKKNTPLYYSTNLFETDLPEAIQKFCKENAIATSMAQSEDGRGWRLLDTRDYTPGIYISYKNGGYGVGMMFHLMDVEPVKNDSDKLTVIQTLANYPVDKRQWEAWVTQSINRTSINVVDRIYNEIAIAGDLKATYISDNSFVSSLVQQSFENNPTPETITASQIMNLTLPFIDKIDLDKLMAVRQFEQDVFTNFRIELERQFRELRFVTDPKELKDRQENILHELGDSQVKKINIKLNSLKKKAFFQSAILAGSLTGSVMTGGWSLLTAAMASFSGYSTYLEYKENLKENPSFLLWKVLKNKN